MAVAATQPANVAEQLLDSARQAFDSGVAPTAIIAGVLALAAAVTVAMVFPKSFDGDEKVTPDAVSAP